MALNNYITFPHASEAARFSENWDLHSHTTFGDGKNSVKEMLKSAEDKGFKVFALTEHVRSSAQIWWPEYVAEIKAQRQSMNMKVLIGIEANAIGPAGNVDVTGQMWEDAELVLGAVHGYYVDDTWEKIKDGSMPREKALKYELEKAIGLCENKGIHVLAHPGWLFEKFYGEMPVAALKLIFEKAAECEVAIELNGWYLRNREKFIKTLLEVNPRISFGSNAHSSDGIKNVMSDLARYFNEVSPAAAEEQ